MEIHVRIHILIVAVGKSNLILQYTQKKFNTSHEVTIGVEFEATSIQIFDKTYRLQLWDTAGQETFKSITRTYYKNSACAIVCYDITNRASFENVKTWVSECHDNAPKTIKLILVGNKSDLDQK